MAHTEELLAQIRERLDHPANIRDLLRALRVPRESRPAFRRQIRALVATGQLVETRSGLFGLPERMDLAPGRLSVHPNGYGFVEPDRAREDGASIYVAGQNLHEAMHGDRVLARIERHGAGLRPEGRIVRVLERASTVFVGRLDEDTGGLRFVVPFDRRLLADVQVPRGEDRGAAPGDMVGVEITRWPTPTRPPLGRVVEVIGSLDTPGVDVTIVIRKHGIPEAHDEETVEEARRLGTTVRPRDLEGRTDFREQPIVTIDGEHARDFDDAIGVERLPNGNFWLGVHIADVSHYVREGSALDRAAYERATSVYFPERAVHMFPPELATELCSLNPHVDRLVQSCLMEIDAQGNVRRYELHDGVIRSAARMTYTEVNAIIEGDKTVRARHADLVPLFEEMHVLFRALNARRRRRGSVDFDLPEPEVLLDAEGRIEDIVASERNVAHRLIEEFMLVANETVARHLEDHDVPTLYRVHERPDPLKVAEFEEFVATLGHSLNAGGEVVRPRHFQKLVERIHGTPEERAVAFLMLRTMQKARYDPTNLGHFGLATDCYTHFTSPIRRYPDLVVHRTLREQRHGRLSDELKAERREDLPDAARHTSERERRADEAERELIQWKKVRFMADKIGDTFDGYVTGVAPFGLFVELQAHFVEGLVPVSSMADDYYHYSERGHMLKGDATGKIYRLGDRVRVLVSRVDLERRQVELGLVEILDRVRRNSRGRDATVKPRAPHDARATTPVRATSRTARGAAERDTAKKTRSRVRKQRPGKRERAARRRR